MGQQIKGGVLEKLSPEERQRLLAITQEYGIRADDPIWAALAAMERGILAMEQAATQVQQSAHRLESMQGQEAVKLKELSITLPEAQEVKDLKSHFAELLATTEQIRDQTTAVIKKRDGNLDESLQGLRDVQENMHRLLTDNGAARWRRCADHAIEQVEAINETTVEVRKRIEETCDGLQKRVDAACKQITRARGQAVGRLQALHYQFILWLAGSVFASAVLAAILTSWVATGRPPWTAYTDHTRRLSHGVILERAWPKLSVQERQRIERAAQR